MKKTTAIAAVCLACLTAAGCSQNTQAPLSTQPAQTVSETDALVTEDTNDPIRFTDQAGNEIELDRPPERVIISSIFPIPSVFALFRGSGAEIVGMNPSAMEAAENSYLAQVYPEILDADTSFVQGGEINIESVAALDPDLVIYSAQNPEEKALYDSLGIPSAAFSPAGQGFDCVETYISWNELLGEIYGENAAAAEIAEKARDSAKKITDVTDTIPEEEKPTAVILFNCANGSIKAAGTGSFGDYWITAAGGINAAAEVKGHADVSIEQLYTWDPDILLLSNFVPASPEQVIKGENDTDLTGLRAVQEGKVYKYPTGFYRWYPASSDAPLSLEWTALHIQPGYFADLDFPSDIKDWYMNVYGLTLSDEEVQALTD